MFFSKRSFQLKNEWEKKGTNFVSFTEMYKVGQNIEIENPNSSSNIYWQYIIFFKLLEERVKG